MVVPEDFQGENGLYVMTANLRILAPGESLDVIPINDPNRPKFHRLSGDETKAECFVGKKYVEHGPMAESLAERTVNEGVARFAELPADEKSPLKLQPAGFAPRGLPPEGFLVLRNFCRALDRDGRGEVQRQEYLSLRNAGPQRDFLWLTPREWRSLIPEDPKPGGVFSWPEDITQRVMRFYLSNGTAGVKFKWARSHCRSGVLQSRVEEITPERLVMSLEGEAQLANHEKSERARRHAHFRIQGQLTYDRVNERFVQFDAIALGEEYDKRPKVEREWKHYGDPSGRTALGLAFELAEPGSLGFGLPPWFIRYGSPEELRAYFGKDQTEEVWNGLARYFDLESVQPLAGE